MKTWAVGDNKFVFDGTTGFWNHSVVYPGFSLQSFTEMYARAHVPITVCPSYPHRHVTQYPTLDAIQSGLSDGKPGLLRGQLHRRIEMLRGHMDGNVAFPWGLSYLGFKTGSRLGRFVYKGHYLPRPNAFGPELQLVPNREGWSR